MVDVAFGEILIQGKRIEIGFSFGCLLDFGANQLMLHTKDVNFMVALVVGLTLAVTVLCANMVGCTLPMLAKKLGFDPAVMASPFITTIVDALSLLVYFGIATALLKL